MKNQFVTSEGMTPSAPRTTTGLVTGQPATAQPNPSRGSSKLRRAIGPLLAAAATLQAAVVLGGPPAYTFKPIAFVGGPTPGGSTFNGDFEPSGMNNRGECAFVADYEVNGVEGEGIFIGGAGEGLRQVLGFGQPAPGTGGGVFGPWEEGNLGFNDEGDVAILFTLDPFTHWLTWLNGFYAGVWRYSHETQQLTPVVVPGDPIPGLGGDTFKGIGLDVSMNNQGTIAFEGIVSVDPLTLGTDGPVDTMTAGVFVASKHGRISPVALPGGPAPNGDTWDSAVNPSINAAGDMSFGAKTSGAIAAGRGESIYLRRAATGEILAVGKAGTPAPGGGMLLAGDESRINDRGDVVFTGYLDGEAISPVGGPVGAFLYRDGTLVRVAGPGDAMPGGGHLAFVSGYLNNIGLNNSGTVVFTAGLDTVGDEGLYAWSHGSLHLIARTGTVIPGLGTILSLEMGSGLSPSGYPAGSGKLNERGQLVFGCTLTDGRAVLLLATPTGVK